MAKDSYWFKHDTTAGRGLRLRKIQHIYGHEGKGFYWDVIEVLREQEGYKYPYSETDIQMLGSIISVKDSVKFENFIKDCISFNLFFIEDNFLLNKPLNESMTAWETKKTNGLKAKLKRNRSEPKAKRKHKRREEKRREEGKGKFLPPSLEEVRQYFRDKGYNEEIAEKAYLSYSENNWFYSHGNPVLNWKQKMINVWFEPKHKATQANPPVEKIDASTIFNEVD